MKKINGETSLLMILNEYCSDVDKRTLERIYRMCTKRMQDFFMIDLRTCDMRWKYRKNYTPLEVQ